MSQADIRNSAVLGFIVACILIVIKLSGNIPYLQNIPFLEFSLLAFPAFFVLAMYLAVQSGVAVIVQGAKFLQVGALNTFVDVGLLNVLIAVSGIAMGVEFSAFKGISFLAALLNSYYWNRTWTFGLRIGEKYDTGQQRNVFLQFIIVSGIGFFLNVSTASFVVNVLGPQFNISAPTWASVAAIIGTFAVLTWNFFGYKLIVFRK